MAKDRDEDLEWFRGIVDRLKSRGQWHDANDLEAWLYTVVVQPEHEQRMLDGGGK